MNDLYPQTHLSSESHINRTVRLTNWWHQCLDGRESEQAPGAGDGQGGLGCCSPRGCRVRYDWATELNWQADPGREHLHTAARPLVLRCCSTKPHPHISMRPSVWGFKFFISGREVLIKTKKPWKLQGPLKIHPEDRSRLASVIRLRGETILKASP